MLSHHIAKNDLSYLEDSLLPFYGTRSNDCGSLGNAPTSESFADVLHPSLRKTLVEQTTPICYTLNPINWETYGSTNSISTLYPGF